MGVGNGEWGVGRWGRNYQLRIANCELRIANTLPLVIQLPPNQSDNFQSRD
jgi:hypothetical protein